MDGPGSRVVAVVLDHRFLDGYPLPPDPLLQPSISGTDLDKFRKALMGHCDINGDEKNELALGLKLS
ncbi:hypothetical protein CesoFtcFv8_015013 [Champsocephalus esox]|uniref:Uncharacterized protein n=1 Tax=Champsocephalus esox TaxID=159716 RepID=A0AAN8BNZ0_9TELE|nr:hypothetical protein CesoFtcFv8_015013 [Champsocephalus esox]